MWYGGQWLDAMRSNGRLCWDFFFGEEDLRNAVTLVEGTYT